MMEAYWGVGLGVDVKALRALRVLRSLRIVNGVPALTRVMESIVASLPHLKHVATLVVAVLILYGIVGVQFFGGKLSSRCVDLSTGQFSGQRPCIPFNSTSSGRKCHLGEICTRDLGISAPNPNQGVTSFDNIGSAMLTVFQCLTLEGWSDIWYMTNDAVGWEFPWIYFLTLVFFGSFFVLNLVLGIMHGQFARADERTSFKNDVKRRKLKHLKEVHDDAVEDYGTWIGAGYAEDWVPDEDEEQHAKHRPSRRVSEISAADVAKAHKEPPAARNKFGEKIVAHNAFVALILILVLGNTITMATEHADQPDYWTDFLYGTNIFFVAAFAIEMVFKLWALGPGLYWHDPFNRFDAIVVVLSTIEIALFELFGLPGFGVAVFRAIRLTRAVSMIRTWWEPIRALTYRLIQNVETIGSMLGLLQLFILIFGLLGMQIFGGKEPVSSSRSNFDDFWAAYLTIFQVLTGENWNEIMYDCMSVQKDSAGWQIFVAIYFLVLVVVGNYVILNVFLAIAVDCLDALLEALKENQTKNPTSVWKEADEELKTIGKETYAEKKRVEQNSFLSDFEGIHANRASSASVADTAQHTVFPAMASEDTAVPELVDEQGNPVETENAARKRENAALRRLSSTYGLAYVLDNEGAELQPDIEEETNDKAIPESSSLFIFSPTNAFRVLCNEIRIYWLFDPVILFCILASSICLAAEDPVDINAPENGVLAYFDFVFTGIFTIEMLLKIVSLGFIVHTGAYLRDGWNVLDFVAVCASLISIGLAASNASSGAMGAVRVLRVVRVLRPLRSIKRIPALRQIVMCLIRSLKNITTVFFITFGSMFLFAVIGTTLFKGAFHQCTYNDGVSEDGRYIPLANCTVPDMKATCPDFHSGEGQFLFHSNDHVVQKKVDSSPDEWSTVLVGDSFSEGIHSTTLTYSAANVTCTDAAGVVPKGTNATVPGNSTSLPTAASCLGHYQQEVAVGFGVYDELNGRFYGVSRLNDTHMEESAYPGLRLQAGDSIDIIADMDDHVLKYHVDGETDFVVAQGSDARVSAAQLPTTKLATDGLFFAVRVKYATARVSLASCVDTGTFIFNKNQYMNFDNVANSMQTLFAAATTEGWITTLYNTIDASGNQETMAKQNNPGAAVFLVVYMVIVSFFLMNLFIGFVIVTYQDASDDDFDGCVLDSGDREMLEYIMTCTVPKSNAPPEDAGWLRKWCYATSSPITNPKFDYAIMVVIALNLLVLMMSHDGMNDDWVLGLYVANCIFTGIFFVEFVIKIIGFTPKGYFSDGWNVFDFVVVIGSLVDSITEGVGDSGLISLNFLRLFRALRLVKLMKHGKLRLLLDTFVKSMAELPYVVLLIGLLFFLYAVVGMQLFGTVAQDPDRSINDLANFTTLFYAMTVLVRVSTGEDWQNIMKDLELEDGVECGLTNGTSLIDDCGTPIARVYMISFVVLSTFIVLNLFVAVICDHFEYLVKDENELDTTILSDFVMGWAKMDQQDTGSITHVQFRDLLLTIDPPLGLKGCPDFIVNHKMRQLDCKLVVPEASPNDPSTYRVEFRPAFMSLIKCQRGTKSLSGIRYCKWYNEGKKCPDGEFCKHVHACARCDQKGGHGEMQCKENPDNVKRTMSWKYWPNEQIAKVVKHYMKHVADLPGSPSPLSDDTYCKTEEDAILCASTHGEEQGEPCHFEKVAEGRFIVYRTRDRKVMKNTPKLVDQVLPSIDTACEHRQHNDRIREAYIIERQAEELFAHRIQLQGNTKMEKILDAAIRSVQKGESLQDIIHVIWARNGKAGDFMSARGHDGATGTVSRDFSSDGREADYSALCRELTRIDKETRIDSEVALQEKYQKCLCLSSVRSFYLVLSLQSWWRKRYANFKYECKHCKHKFAKQDLYDEHMQKHHQGELPQIYPCNTQKATQTGTRSTVKCVEVYSTRNAVERCKNLHAHEALFCDACGIDFNPEAYNKPNRKVPCHNAHMGRSPVCTDVTACAPCLKDAKRAFEHHIATVHQRIPEDQWPLRCLACSRRFLTRDGLAGVSMWRCGVWQVCGTEPVHGKCARAGFCVCVCACLYVCLPHMLSLSVCVCVFVLVSLARRRCGCCSARRIRALRRRRRWRCCAASAASFDILQPHADGEPREPGRDQHQDDLK